MQSNHKKIEADISILIGQETTTIELRDSNSRKLIAEVTLTASQLSQALSRLKHVPCEAVLFDSYKDAGKKMEMEKFAFPIPENTNKKDVRILNGLAEGALYLMGRAEWTPDKYYKSQDSFFKKDGVQYARTTIRRWVDVNDKSE